MVPRRRRAVATRLGPDLWAVLAVLDRAFGTDQVTLVRVTPRLHS